MELGTQLLLGHGPATWQVLPQTIKVGRPALERPPEGEGGLLLAAKVVQGPDWIGEGGGIGPRYSPPFLLAEGDQE